MNTGGGGAVTFPGVFRERAWKLLRVFRERAYCGPSVFREHVYHSPRMFSSVMDPVGSAFNLGLDLDPGSKSVFGIRIRVPDPVG
jgi:hypothetical protein